MQNNSLSLTRNVDSNIVESFNAIIAKLIGGKGIILSLKGLCAIVTATKKTKRPFYSLYRSLIKKVHLKNYNQSKWKYYGEITSSNKIIV